MGLWDWIVWNLWQKWRYHWKHRKDTREQAFAELEKQWSNVLEAFADEPAGRELHDCIDGMETVRQAFKTDSADDKGR